MVTLRGIEKDFMGFNGDHEMIIGIYCNGIIMMDNNDETN